MPCFFLRHPARVLLMYYVYIPLLVLVFLGSCRLLFGKGRICGCPTQSKHQADNLAKLRQKFLSVTKLIAKIFGAVSRTTSLIRLSALLVSKRCRCRDDGFCSGCACVAHVLRVRSATRSRLPWLLPFAFRQGAHSICLCALFHKSRALYAYTCALCAGAMSDGL